MVATADGYLNLGVGGDGQWRALCAAVGRAELADDPDYRTAEDRYANRPACWALLAPIFAARTTAAWLDILEAHGVPAGPIYRVDEMFTDPQVRHLGIARPVTHRARGEMRVIGQPLTLSRTPASIDAAAPDAGQNTDEVLREHGYSDAEIAGLREAGVV